MPTSPVLGPIEGDPLVIVMHDRDHYEKSICDRSKALPKSADGTSGESIRGDVRY
jgi:hypothetical protein